MPPEIRSLATIQTDEGIPLTLELAGVASRIAAYFMDSCALFLGLGLAGFVLLLLMTRLWHTAHWSEYLGKEVLTTVLPVTLLAVPLLYFFLQEWLWRGRTLGKWLMKIRVVRSNGQPIGFWEAFGRNLLRLLDVFVAGIGLFAMLLSKSERRFGDFLVGTLVIQEEMVVLGRKSQPPVIQPNQCFENSYRISVEEMALVKDFLARQKQFYPETALALENQLRDYFKTRLHLSDETVQAPDFLVKLLA